MRPTKHKKKDRKVSVCLTQQRFAFVKGKDEVKGLLIGNKQHHIGLLSSKRHHKYSTPNALYIRKKQDKFLCVSYGHTDNEDINAAKVIKQRAIELMLKAGAELSKKGCALFRIVDVVTTLDVRVC